MKISIKKYGVFLLLLISVTFSTAQVGGISGAKLCVLDAGALSATLVYIFSTMKFLQLFLLLLLEAARSLICPMATFQLIRPKYIRI